MVVKSKVKVTSADELEEMYQYEIRASLRIIGDIEQLIAATKGCLTSPNPGFPIYMPDLLTQMGSLLAVAGRAGALKESRALLSKKK